MIPHARRFLEPAPLWATDGLSEAPVVVRYTTDRFMEALAADLAANALNARRVSDDTRLFQAGHGHFAIALCSLVCEILGRPDHLPTRGESVGFVVRRQLTSGGESAWVPEGSLGRWVAASQQSLVAGEEVIGAFPVRTTRGGRPRVLWGAVVPVAGRERYEQAPLPADTSPRGHGLAERLARVFVEPVRSLGRLGAGALREAESARALQELALALDAEIGVDWADRAGKVLRGVTLAARWGEVSLLDALLDVSARAANGQTSAHSSFDLKNLSKGDDLDALVEALTALAPKSPPPVAGLPASPGYILRFVFSEPACAHRPVRHTLSAATPRLRFAGFLDADAPHRPVRIELPSLSTLSAVQHTVGIVTDAATDAAMQQAGHPDVLDGDVPAAQPDGGWITLYAIPILTICATALMMIIATLLNLVFWWLPFLKIRIRRPA